MKKFFELFYWETSVIFKDKANVLILYIAGVLYAFLYGFLYGPQTVENMPIAVVDMDETYMSHYYSSLYNSTPQVKVTSHPKSMDIAKKMLLEREVSGIVYIPSDFESNILSGKQVHVGVYSDGSYFLLYAAMSKAASGASLMLGRQIQYNRFVAQGQSPQVAKFLSQPVEFSVETLYNPGSGYATAIMPSVFLLILQQTLLLVIGMVIGTEYEFKLWRRLNRYKTMQILLAKISAYFVAAIPSAVFLFAIAYKIFDYPRLENPLDLITFFIPFILAVVCMGIALGGLFHRREASILYIAPFSILILLWSGVSWPQESMPGWFYNIGYIFPSSAGIRGLVSMRTCGESLQDIMDSYVNLWILSGVYFILAYYSMRANRRHSIE